MIEDILLTVETVISDIAPPGQSPIVASEGATGVVAWDAANAIFGTFSCILTVTTSGATDTAQGTLSLDGGLTTSPPFILTSLPYPVPLLDPINAGGDPSPVLSGLVLDFSGTFTEGDSYTFSAIGQTTFWYGEENLPSQDSIFPRVIWVPVSDSYSGSEDYALGTTQRNSPRSLMTTVSQVDAHIWGIDRRRTDILRQQVINGIHFAAQNVYSIDSGQWQLNNDQISKFGALYVLRFSVKEPLTVFPPEFVQAPPPFAPNITPVFDD